MQVTNTICGSCDYATACKKKIVKDNVLVKDQAELEPKCLCIVNDVCRDCKLFKDRKCASWKIFNGKRWGELSHCPKKIPVGR